ncbi:MAG: hypothetical protein K2Z80_35645 [Xanthobacteraceae bacterium]|nr:hypothetical protein [Xanthobacteraceae bacterium]
MSPATAIALLCLATALAGREALAQDRIVIKNGETIELHSVYFVAKCRSIMVGLPEVEVLEGPQEVKLSIKEGEVLPRRFNCAKPVQGGTLTATAKDITEPKAAKLTYRIKYKTKDGERQTARVYSVSLFP